MDDDKYTALARHLGATVATAVAGRQKGTTMKPHEEVGWDWYDILNAISDADGDAAKMEAQKAVGDLATRYPRATARVIGPQQADAYRVRYKQAQDAQDTIDRAIEGLRQSATLAAEYMTDQQIAATIDALARQLSSAATRGAPMTTKTAAPASALEAIMNGQPLSSVRPTQPAYDALGDALGADQKGAKR